MRRERRFLLACIAVTCAALIAVVLPVPVVLRTLIALPLVFVLPGAACLRALDLQFTPLAHAPIAVGISMAITVLSGLALNGLGGLTPLGWAAWLGGFTIVAAAVAARRDAIAVRRPLPAAKIRHGAMLAGTAAMLALTVLGTLRSTAAYRPFPHTSFWMLPEEDDSNIYLIGIKNDEGRPESYAVQLLVEGRATGEWQDLTLAPGQSETYPAIVPRGAAAQAWLYRAEQPDTIYRRVTIAGNDEMGTGAGAQGASP